MNIYLIEQSENDDYDTYDSAVVAAENGLLAANTHPSGRWTTKDASWTQNLMNVKVTPLGVAKEGTEAGVICASFNAG